MSFELKVVNDLWEVKFTQQQPSYIRALKMAPSHMEPELKFGIWLVVVFPVWSTTVRQSVSEAISVTKDYGGRFHLGIRPSDYHEELEKWWPSSQVPAGSDNLLVAQDDSRRAVHISTDPSGSPVWLVLRDGQVVHQGAGPRSKEQLSELMKSLVGL